MKFCAGCGAKPDEGAKFCMQCGAAIGGVSAAKPHDLASYPSAAREQPANAGREVEANQKGAASIAPFIIILAALLVLGGGAAYFLLISRDYDVPSSPAISNHLPDSYHDGAASDQISPATPPQASITPPPPPPAPPAQPSQEPPFQSHPGTQPPLPQTVLSYTLPEAIFQTNNWVRLSAYWSGNRVTVFERDRGSSVWTMVNRDGDFRVVEPTFSQTPEAFVIAFPTSASEYHFHDDGTGSFGAEALTWDFITDPDFSLGSISGAYLTYDLQDAMSRHMLVAIRVYWDSGQTIFYRYGSGGWIMRGRGGATTSVYPTIGFFSNFVTMSFPDSSNYYIFESGGTGSFGTERMSWDYSYYGFT